ncbi:hypothetical protein DQ04_00981020 [Trypanosoma grayi]|uniref:hypothetical protein n=1 Tax=Trypanosoma grayi TaxID=71804 RepID=UPI0004F483B0|nr:hypothetical protein DQ04_00981020 [Trypanosoma grayi]KEG13472.1 hypothetical protein DQ04_00981020 [Trypanosoma grayi]
MEPHHLLLDMNAVVHATVRQNRFTSRTTIRDVIAAVKRFLKVFPPSETLILVFDGAAPIAKLKTQKERRAGMPSPHAVSHPPPPSPHPSDSCSSVVASQRYNYDYCGTEVQLLREEILSGSEFLLACEDAVRCALDDVGEDGGELGGLPGRTIIISGCAEAGEGELKMSSIIRELWLKQRREETYTGNDVFVVVGNDSDLALIGIACTPYTHYYMVDPVDLAITSVGKLFDHWMGSVPNGRLPAELLPSFRIDFVLLMLLGGGDWYEGIGGRTTQLWRRYRDLRINGGYYRKSLIQGEAFNINVEFIRAVMDVKPSRHHVTRLSKIKQATLRGTSSLTPAAVESGVELLKGAMWALRSIVGGQCFDYGFRVYPKDPTTGTLKAAVHVKKLAERIRPASSAPLPLFAPLEQCIAVLGKRGRFSSEIWRAMTTVNADGGEKLTHSRSITYLLTQVRLLMAGVDTQRLTAAERTLLNVQHRNLCGAGECAQEAVTFMSFTHSAPSNGN